MKLILTTLFCAVLIGCTTSSQRTAYNTIFSVEQTATLGVDDYFTLVIKGTLTTNGVPIIAKSYNDLQAAGALAATASAAGTNALATSSLILEATDLGNLITTIEQSTKT
jgi:hypothetical protein